MKEVEVGWPFESVRMEDERVIQDGNCWDSWAITRTLQQSIGSSDAWENIVVVSDLVNEREGMRLEEEAIS